MAFTYDKLKSQYDLSDLDVLKMKRAISILKKNFLLLLIIYGTALYLNLFIDVLIMHTSYFILRLFSFGAHLNHFLMCMIYSVLIFIGVPYLIHLYEPDIYYFSLICLPIVCMYAPSETHKHPIHSKHRSKLKVQSLIIVLTLLIIIFSLRHPVSNLMAAGLIIQSISLLPIFQKERFS